MYQACVFVLFGIYVFYFLLVAERTNGDRVYTNAAMASLFVLLGWATVLLVLMFVGPTGVLVPLLMAVVPIVLLTELSTWGRLLVNMVVTTVNMYVTNIPIMIFAVANLDSAVWGTRTSEQVDSEAKDAFRVKMRLQKLAIATLYFGANFSFCFWVSDFSSLFTVWAVAGIASILLYVFSLFEWRRQKAYLRALGLDEHHDDVWPPDHYGNRRARRRPRRPSCSSSCSCSRAGTSCAAPRPRPARCRCRGTCRRGTRYTSCRWRGRTSSSAAART